MLTHTRPVVARIKGTRDAVNFYMVPGEPIGITHMCEAGTLALFGELPDVMRTVRVRLTGTVER